MAALNPYLHFNGNAAEAFDFYKSVFGGEFDMVMRFGDVPAEYRMNESENAKIMHISLPIGNGSILMGSDTPEKYGTVQPGSSIHISITTDSREEADQLFKGLSEGGNAYMPMADAFWGSYFGMLKDKYEVEWMISYDNSRG